MADLFFSSRIVPALEAMGYSLWLATSADALETQSRRSPPSLMLVDLGIRGADWEAAVLRLRTERPDLPILAFGPHKDLEARERALAAGCSEVVANSKLALDLPRLVARWLPAP